MAENLQYTFASALHTPTADLEMEDQDEGECDKALMCMHMHMYEDPEEEEDNARKWRQIVSDATKRPLQFGDLSEVDSAFSISSEHSEIGQSVTEECNQVTATRDGTKPAEPPPEIIQYHKLTTEQFSDQKILPQKYVDVRHDENYVSVGPATVKGEIETQLYRRMVKAAVKLNKSHKHVRGMTKS